MDNRSYEIKYRFKSGKGDILQEVKYIDIPESAPKSVKYQWFHMLDNRCVPLQFISQNGTTRSFIEGTLIIFPDHCLFNGEMYEYQKVSLSTVYSTDYYFNRSI